MSARRPASRKESGPTLFATGEAAPEVAGNERRLDQTVNSALWAAYGDALGFISELTDADGLKRRTRGVPLTLPMAWQRRIGGRQGVGVSLPEGCYSDDTQLRLSTGRAIGTNGFDVEAFAKVELTVWPSYALGGGKGTKAAASNLTRDQVAWYSNFFSGWINSGGNGAAMRIQPHVWAARDLTDPASYLPDVIRNCICTHGSPTGILGAVLHAGAVAEAMLSRNVPEPAQVLHHLALAESVPELMSKDSEVGGLWVRVWEKESNRAFPEAWHLVVDEARHAVLAAADQTGGAPVDRYRHVLEILRLYLPEKRGSGLLTAVAALGLLWAEPRASEAMTLAANAVGSDTDTIATMAGAIVGAATDEPPAVQILDTDLIREEAGRLARIGEGQAEHGHYYPDLLHWEAPRTQADALLEGDGGLFVTGLGPAKPLASDPVSSPKGDFLWQWVKLSFGQSLLIKRRPTLARVHHVREPVRETDAQATEQTGSAVTLLRSDQTGLRSDEGFDSSNTSFERQPPSNRIDRGVDLEKVFDWLRSQGIISDVAVGYAIRRVARDGTPDQLALFVGMLRDELRR